MIPAAFEYHRARSIDEAIAALASGSGGKLLAGGHSLVPLMKLRMSEPARLIDIGRIQELAGIRETNGRIEIGAGTTHHDVATSQLLARVCPMVAETAADIGDPQVRNRGTIGGSLAHADPAADYPAVMLALDADIVIRSTRGERVAKSADFFQGLFTVDLAPDELIIAVRFTPIRSAAYAKLHQRASHFAIVGVAAALNLTSGKIDAARVGVTGAATHATRLAQVEAALAGQPATAETARTAAAVASVDDLNSDLHASEEYRRAMIPVFTRRAIEAAIARL
jgi:aerobic carbon-monoxide dehydrogenase medium subunit